MRTIAYNILITLLGFILSRVVFFYLYELITWIVNKHKVKLNCKSQAKIILETLSNNKSFISVVSEMIDEKSGIDIITAKNIVNLEIVQIEIQKLLNKNKEDLNKKGIETYLINVFLKAWKK